MQLLLEEGEQEEANRKLDERIEKLKTLAANHAAQPGEVDAAHAAIARLMKRRQG
jgi:hypothetical protein